MLVLVLAGPARVGLGIERHICALWSSHVEVSIHIESLVLWSCYQCVLYVSQPRRGRHRSALLVDAYNTDIWTLRRLVPAPHN